MHRRKTASLGGVRDLVLCAAFALRVANASLSFSFDFSSSADAATFPNCIGTTGYISDGFCDYTNNNMECGYDGGDCCECSCVSTTHFCGRNGFDCLDPEVGDPTPGCEVVPIPPPVVSSCAADTLYEWTVETTADADTLADDILCSGGMFFVTWKGYVSVAKTIYVIHGTVLQVDGVSDAVAYGGGTTQLFSVFNGSLLVSDMEMSNGAAIHGGAISATQKSDVTLSRVTFSSNTADGFGGAIHLDSSAMELANSSTFSGNSAIYGGAIYMASSSTLVQHVGSGEMYRFVDNNATDGGALYVSGLSIVAECDQMQFTPTSSYVSSSSDSEDSLTSWLSFVLNQYRSRLDYFKGCYSTVDVIDSDTSFINNTVQNSGGAVYVDGIAFGSWVGEVIFEGNSADYGGALFMGDGITIQWQGTTSFTGNSAWKDGGAVASAVDEPYPIIHWYGAVTFVNNTCGGNGGALALFGDMVVSFGNKTAEFSGNSAALFGGAVYISEASKGLQFVHAVFTHNQAQNGGAVLAAGCGTFRTTDTSGSTTYFPTSFSNCTFIGNSAVVMGGAIEITVGRVNVKTSRFSGNTASVGGAVRIFGAAELFNSTFSENTSGEDGGSSISIVGTISEMNGLDFSANRFMCAEAEYVKLTEGSGFEATCQGCDTTCQGYFVEDNNSVPTCTAMFQHAHSENGTATIERVIVEPGYWRADNQSEIVLPCYNADACRGGLTDDPGYCNNGYKGPYCSVCKGNYTETLAFSCSKCSAGNVAVVVVVVTIAILAALAFVWHMVSIDKEDATRGVTFRVRKLFPLQSIKIIIVTWQIVTQFSSAAQVIYPESYERLLGAVAFLINFDIAWMLSAGCIMEVNFHDGLLLATIGPIVVITLLGITYIVAIHRNRGSEVALHSVRRKHLGTIVFLTFFIYSFVSSTIFRTFACDELDDENVYLRADYRIKCDSSRHKVFKIYAGFMIIVYPVGIPLFYTFLLFRHRNVSVQGLDHETPRYDSTSILREPYRPSVFYYELVECSRRVMLTGVVVFIYPNTAPQIAVTTLIAFTFVMVSEGLSPYASRWDTWVSRAGHVIVFLSVYVALLLRVDISNESRREQNIFAGILVAAHGVMVSLVIIETTALMYSMRNQERSLPVSRS